MKNINSSVFFISLVVRLYLCKKYIDFVQKNDSMLYREGDSYREDEENEDFYEEEDDYDDIEGSYLEDDDMDEDKYYYGDDYEE